MFLLSDEEDSTESDLTAGLNETQHKSEASVFPERIPESTAEERFCPAPSEQEAVSTKKRNEKIAVKKIFFPFI